MKKRIFVERWIPRGSKVYILNDKKEWEEFYMGDDGNFTMYIDLVNQEFAKSSVSTERYPITENIRDMFNKIKGE